ncbi:MAG: hydroxyethylthiazole kinase [Coprobacillus sp.]
MIEECLKNVREKTPLVHNITNYVTVNDCANILLACGGSPIMADDEKEVEEITTICGGLNINIGTLNTRTIQSMIKAGRKANELGHPVILDPVGAGASQLRTQTALKLLDEIQFTVIKGNISEIKTLALGSGKTQGVDASIDDVVTKENLNKTIMFAKELSKKTKAIIAITGAIDIVCDSQDAYVIENGTAMLSRITGTGCMLSAMTAAYLVANPENLLQATACSVMAMGIAGEVAEARLTNVDGNATFRNYVIDAIYQMDENTLKDKAKYEKC